MKKTLLTLSLALMALSLIQGCANLSVSSLIDTCDINVAIQLYSLRNDCEKDLEGTLKAVAEMGYDGVELAGFYGHEPSFIKALCDRLGLKIISAHVERKVLAADPEGQADLYASLGCKYVALPWAEPEIDMPGYPGYPKFLSDIKAISEAMDKRGIKLLYHSHDFEFRRINDGCLMDRLLVDTDGMMDSELDTCWCHVGGYSPTQYMLDHKTRMEVIHFKDYVGTPKAVYSLIGKEENEEGAKESDFEYRPLGEGKLNLKALYNAAKDIKATWIIVEQDEPSKGMTALECARKSLENLNAINE